MGYCDQIIKNLTKQPPKDCKLDHALLLATLNKKLKLNHINQS